MEEVEQSVVEQADMPFCLTRCFGLRLVQKATKDINVLSPGHFYEGELRRYEIGPSEVTMPAKPEAIASNKA